MIDILLYQLKTSWVTIYLIGQCEEQLCMPGLNDLVALIFCLG
jgi:hypothetical protein